MSDTEHIHKKVSRAGDTYVQFIFLFVGKTEQKRCNTACKFMFFKLSCSRILAGILLKDEWQTRLVH